MKRKVIESYIDKWIDRESTLSETLVVEQALKVRQDQLFKERNEGIISKRSWKDEFSCIQIVRKRIELTLPVMIQDSLDKQAYLMLPAHEKCDIVRYRYLASFRINALNIRKVKGFHLLESLGWYDRDFNPGGVVKDHRVSIKYGFDNNVDPELIGHLANCEFLPVKANLAKSSSCSLTLKELRNEINGWK
jgi:hypothetical protein